MLVCYIYGVLWSACHSDMLHTWCTLISLHLDIVFVTYMVCFGQLVRDHHHVTYMVYFGQPAFRCHVTYMVYFGQTCNLHGVYFGQLVIQAPCYMHGVCSSFRHCGTYMVYTLVSTSFRHHATYIVYVRHSDIVVHTWCILWSAHLSGIMLHT